MATLTIVLNGILTKKAQDPAADEEPANESLQKKVDFS